MNIYLAGQNLWTFAWQKGELSPKKVSDINILQSFYYADNLLTSLIPYTKNFMLDSGAFTFLQQSKNLNWDEYIDKYITYIKTNKVKKFIELDIDALVGYDRVKEIRRKLEREIGIQPIPVWHKRLGKDEFLKMCDEYKYVALGGIAIKEFTKEEHKYFTWFINEAHKRECKIHGLGYTNLKGLKKYHFDSVDSTAWTTGNRFGYVYKFNGKTIVKLDRPANSRIKHKEVAIQNFNAWVQFAKYVELNY